MKNLTLTVIALIFSFCSFAAVTGPANICINTVTTYTDPAVSSGTWTSSNPAVASINIITGVLTAGGTAGSIIITHFDPAGSGTSTMTVNIYSSIPALSGDTTVCIGTPAMLSNAVSGGIWSSYNSTVATVNPSSGIITGVSHGSIIIRYGLNGTACGTEQTVTVFNPLTAITGTSTTCNGNIIYLSSGGASGTWSSNSAIAPIYSDGSVWPNTPGSVVLTFTNASTCGASSLTHNLTVTPGITASTGPYTVCAGASITLSNATAGGTWSSMNTAIGTVNPVSGVVTAAPITAYTSLYIRYTGSGGCYYTSTLSVLPAPTGITGPSSVCAGGSIGLTVAGASSGTWSTSSPLIATLLSPTSGTVYGMTPGSATITYTNTSGCGPASFTHPVTVVSGVAATTGPTTMCAGTTATLANSTSGGTWSSLTSSIATVDVGGMVYATTVGEAHIAYTIGSGCMYAHTVHVTAPTVISGSTTVCVGSNIYLSTTNGGGTWSSSNTSIATVFVPAGTATIGGYVTGASAGSVVVTYFTPGTCAPGYATYNITVSPAVTASTGPGTVCIGNTITFTNPTPGGTWTSATSEASANPATGVVTGMSAGNTYIYYNTSPGCYAISPLVVTAGAGTITGASTICIGTFSPLSNTATGGSWSSSNVGVASVHIVTGLVHGVSTGTAVITYNAGGCSTAITVTVVPTLTVAITAVPSCGGFTTLTASGAASYIWSPGGGSLCTSCTAITVNPTATTIYSVTGSSSGCSASANVTINGNRIAGNINYSGALATDSFRVWLIRYNPIDSSVTALDSTVTCMYAGMPYYQFDNPAAGSYMVKAKKFGTVPGTSGYIPTYGLGSANWNMANTITHAAATNLQNINMIYGTVPSGPGFIAGNVYYGAGRGTTPDVPAQDMLIYLRNTATNVLTYTYTDVSGGYSFSNLAYGDYVIYPEEFDYYTTPSATLTLNAASPSVTGMNFKQHTDNGTITPIDVVSVTTVNSNKALSVFPNPASNTLTIQWKDQAAETAAITIADMTGRNLYSSAMDLSAAGSKKVDLSTFANGLYIISVRSASFNYNSKIEVQH